MTATRAPIKTRNIVGSALILVAILLLLRNIGFSFFGTILDHWPPGLIVLGVVTLLATRGGDGHQYSGRFVGYLLIILGIVFSLWKYEIVQISLSAVIVPLILFLIGVSLLRPDRHPAGAVRHHTQTSHSSHASATSFHREGEPASHVVTTAVASASTETPDIREKIDVFAIFGGGDYNTRSRQLISGEIVCLLGGADVDLREADSRDEVLRIDVVAIMGSVDLKVPPHWEVIVEVTPILAGVANKSVCLADKMQVPRRQLRLTGFALMGSINIHN